MGFSDFIRETVSKSDTVQVLLLLMFLTMMYLFALLNLKHSDEDGE